MHLVDWDSLCQPIKRGGLGLRKTENANLAMIWKLSWRLFSEPSLLWVRVVRAKYRVRSDGWPTSIPIARGIAMGYNKVVSTGKKWNVVSGTKTNFWKDVWLVENPLIDYVIIGGSGIVTSVVVRDFGAPLSGWNWAYLRDLLPDSIIRRLASQGLVDEHDGLDIRPGRKEDRYVESDLPYCRPMDKAVEEP
ncbi:LOW QUALITY PROTEIN: hypothetical protein V2J09_002634 [Rumex salicifolius]